MKNKKVIISIIIIIVIIAAASAVTYTIIKNAPKPEEILSQYFSLLNDKKYEDMYNMLSSASKSEISQEDFVKRNQNIYEGIDAVDIKYTVTGKSKENKTYNVKYDESMSTSAGTINFSNTAKIVKEDKNLKLNWGSYLIDRKSVV